jgi:hypothetical protein
MNRWAWLRNVLAALVVLKLYPNGSLLQEIVIAAATQGALLCHDRVNDRR